MHDLSQHSHWEDLWVAGTRNWTQDLPACKARAPPRSWSPCHVILGLVKLWYYLVLSASVTVVPNDLCSLSVNTCHWECQLYYMLGVNPLFSKLCQFNLREREFCVLLEDWGNGAMHPAWRPVSFCSSELFCLCKLEILTYILRLSLREEGAALPARWFQCGCVNAGLLSLSRPQARRVNIPASCFPAAEETTFMDLLLIRICHCCQGNC